MKAEPKTIHVAAYHDENVHGFTTSTDEAFVAEHHEANRRARLMHTAMFMVEVAPHSTKRQINTYVDEVIKRNSNKRNGSLLALENVRVNLDGTVDYFA